MGQIIPFVTRVRAAHDWTAEERDRLDELERRFAEAGLKVEVVFGTTEDGDPWCVVKDDNEEILLHVARIGGTFVVHYALDDALAEGADLPAMLSERLAWEDDRDDVVLPFSRAQQILILLVATAFFYETAEKAGVATTPLSGEPHLDPVHAAVLAEPHLLADGLPATAHAESARAFFEGAEARPVEWRAAFTEDEAGQVTTHGWAEAVRAGAFAAAPTLAVVDVGGQAAAAPQAPALFDIPKVAAQAVVPPTTPASTNGGGGPSPATFSTFTHPPAPPPSPDARRPPPPTDPDEDKPATPPVPHDPAPADHHVHAELTLDHEALLAVGLGFPHPALA